jgi:hypothetical protein
MVSRLNYLLSVVLLSLTTVYACSLQEKSSDEGSSTSEAQTSQTAEGVAANQGSRTTDGKTYGPYGEGGIERPSVQPTPNPTAGQAWQDAATFTTVVEQPDHRCSSDAMCTAPRFCSQRGYCSNP